MRSVVAESVGAPSEVLRLQTTRFQSPVPAGPDPGDSCTYPCQRSAYHPRQIRIHPGVPPVPSLAAQTVDRRATGHHGRSYGHVAGVCRCRCRAVLPVSVGARHSGVGTRRIEEGDRRVDADDLVALAVALDVSPITLLMPSTTDADGIVAMSAGTATAHQFWRWLAAETPLTGDTASEVFGFIWRSVPNWLLGTEYNLVESGLAPNRTQSVRRRERQLRALEQADGND
jgi:hypothetical protein